MKVEAPKVKHPHPLMQQGTPPQDVEREHIGFFTVFRLGGGGPPKHVETIQNPEQFLEPSTINALVGGGDYVLKACANGQTSGRQHGSVLATTNFAWDGPPNIRTAAATAFHAQAHAAPAAPQHSFFEQAASQGPAIVGAITAGLGGIMQIINSGREAREREERTRREYEEGRRREEREERDRKEARDKQEAEERRDAERRRDEERRDKERLEAEERRTERERMEQARLDQMRADAEARQARETMLLNAVMNRRDPNEAITTMLLQKALAPQPVVQAPVGPSFDNIIDAAKKLKEVTDGDGLEKLIPAVLPLAASPVGQMWMARLGSIVNLNPRPEQMMTQEPIVTQEPPPMQQLPQEAPMSPPPPEQVVVPGPVTIN